MLEKEGEDSHQEDRIDLQATVSIPGIKRKAIPFGETMAGDQDLEPSQDPPGMVFDEDMPPEGSDFGERALDFEEPASSQAGVLIEQDHFEADLDQAEDFMNPMPQYEASTSPRPAFTGGALMAGTKTLLFILFLAALLGAPLFIADHLRSSGKQAKNSTEESSPHKILYYLGRIVQQGREKLIQTPGELFGSSDSGEEK